MDPAAAARQSDPSFNPQFRRGWTGPPRKAERRTAGQRAPLETKTYHSKPKHNDEAAGAQVRAA